MAVNIIFYLIPLAAASWNSESSTSSAVSQRRTQALPAGYEIHELLNGSIPLIVIPTWDVFLGYSDAKKFIKGRMSIDVVYPEAAETFVERPENMVDIPNFGSGSGEINTLSQIKLWDPTTEQTATSVGKVYVGEFSQSLYPYDMSCYPFDIKTVHFQIALQRPAGIFYRLVLGCTGDGATVERKDPDGAVRECAWPINGSFVNFEWDSFTCDLQTNVTINCKMRGTRHWAALLKTYMWPSIVYGLMGFMAFSLGVKLAMPRVATTMLALLSLTNLRNQVIALLPTSQKTSWMEEYFLIAISFMCLNLLGHAVSFHLDSIGRPHTQKMVNKFNLWGVLSLFVVVVVARLHVRQCPQIDPAISALIVGIVASLFISIIIFLVWYHRQAFREAGRKLSASMGTSLGEFYDDNV